MKGARKNYGQGATMTRLTLRLTKEQLQLLKCKNGKGYQDAIIALIDGAQRVDCQAPFIQQSLLTEITPSTFRPIPQAQSPQAQQKHNRKIKWRLELDADTVAFLVGQQIRELLERELTK
jgi:hypothetical protein